MSNTYTETAAPIGEYAIIVSPEDNVAVVKGETYKGLAVTLPNRDIVVLKQTVPPGHRFATRDIPAGEFVLQYGHPIGTSLGIR
ncbi:MAG: SET domain-containing protein, partial [Acidobacteriota bacterium]|nr:SET domain-containing protein [Acidobacteriota bacterium]